MKKITAILLTLVLVFAPAACVNGEIGAANAASATSEVGITSIVLGDEITVSDPKVVVMEAQ